MEYGFTVHAWKWRYLLQEEKDGLPWANIYKTQGYSTILYADLLHRISPKLDIKCENYG
jgi:hypothetical protein